MAAEHDLSAERVRELLAAGEIQLIDVREPREWDAGRIEGARHIELVDLSSQAGSIDRDTPVVFQCRMGGRSTTAADAFRASGYEAFNLEGGILAWVAAGLPLVPDGGEVADH